MVWLGGVQFFVSVSLKALLSEHKSKWIRNITAMIHAVNIITPSLSIFGLFLYSVLRLKQCTPPYQEISSCIAACMDFVMSVTPRLWTNEGDESIKILLNSAGSGITHYRRHERVVIYRACQSMLGPFYV